MAVWHAVVFAVVVCGCLFATTRWRVEPVLALILAAAGFGAATGVSLAQLGKSFGSGFGSTAASIGLAVLAADFVAAMADPRGCLRRPLAVSAIGLVAGMGASPAAAFAVLARMCRLHPIRLGLAISAGQGLLLPSPVTVAATTILGADWRLVLLIGAPCAVVVGLCAGKAIGATKADSAICGAAARHRTPMALSLASLGMAGLLILQSLGDIPSEPLGGGSARELLLGLGRPLILLLAGCTIMLAGAPGFFRRRHAGAGFAGGAVGRAAPLVLLVGCAGGLQSVAQDSHLAEMMAETISAWHAGLLVPILAAGCLKLLQGNALVASITAAGLVLPVLPALGLDTQTGRACAALAVGAGAVAGSHINDGFFWLVAHEAGLTPAQVFARFTTGTLLQSMGALGLLALVLLAHPFG